MSEFASYPIGKKTYGVSDIAHKTYTHSKVAAATTLSAAISVWMRAVLNKIRRQG